VSFRVAFTRISWLINYNPARVRAFNVTLRPSTATKNRARLNFSRTRPPPSDRITVPLHIHRVGLVTKKKPGICGIKIAGQRKNFRTAVAPTHNSRVTVPEIGSRKRALSIDSLEHASRNFPPAFLPSVVVKIDAPAYRYDRTTGAPIFRDS